MTLAAVTARSTGLLEGMGNAGSAQSDPAQSGCSSDSADERASERELRPKLERFGVADAIACRSESLCQTESVVRETVLSAIFVAGARPSCHAFPLKPAAPLWRAIGP